MKERIKSTSFWVGIISAVFLILGAFGVEIGDQTASTVINGICSALVMLGIITPPTGSAPDKSDEFDRTDETTNE